MVTFNEMLVATSISDVPIAHQQNIAELLKRVNVLRAEWGKPMKVTSGYRTLQDHLRIYHDIAKRAGKDFRPESVPMRSQHLIGASIDIYDPGLTLTKWLKEENSKRLVAVQLYAEEGNSNWVHLQLFPPASGKRWFLP